MPKQNPHERWMPPGDWYQHLCERAKKCDPMVITGAASKAEIDRMEKLVDRLEKTAAEKAAEKAANDPLRIARSALYPLWKRAEILRLQETAKPYRRAFAIIGVPEELFATPSPNEIPESAPSNWEVEDFETCIAESTPNVAALEDHASELGSHVATWERSSSEQQLWKAIFALAERVKP